MAADRQFAFGLFRFDTRTGQLWREHSEVKLTPRAAAVLHLLAERAEDLVTKQELFDRVWGGMAVSDDALTSWRWLRSQGIAANHIAVGGDSAGGGLTVSVITRLRDDGDPLPGCAWLASPWTDLTMSGETLVTNK